MAFNLPTNTATVQAWVGGLYGYTLGSTTLASVSADITSYGGLNNTLNAYYSSAFGSTPTGTVASALVANLGIVAGQNGLAATDVANAVAYVTGQLNAAAPSARGVAVNNIIGLFNGLATDTSTMGKTYGAASTAWGSTVSAAVTYSQSNTSDGLLSAVVASNATAAAAQVTKALTTGTDSVVGVVNIAVTGNVGGTSAATFTGGDSITGGTGTNNSLTVTDAGTGSTWTPTSLAGVTINGVQNVTYSSSEAVTASVLPTATTQGYSGLSALSVYSVGGSTVVAAASTASSSVAITATDSALAAASIAIDGGSSVTATANGITTGAGTIKIGNTTQPTGAISLTTTITPATTSYISDALTVKGGTSTSITENASTLPLAVASNTATNVTSTTGTVAITGAASGTVNTTGTTTVAVNQTAANGSAFTYNLPSTLTSVGDYIQFQLYGSTGTFVGVKVTVAGTYSPAQLATVLAGGTVNGLVKYYDETTAWKSTADAKASTALFSFGTPTATQITVTTSSLTGANVIEPVIATQIAGVAHTGTTAKSDVPVATATSGNIPNIVTITDANGTSTSAANTISNVSLSGLEYDPNSVGNVIVSSAVKTLSVTNANGSTYYPVKVVLTNNQQGTTNTTLGLTTQKSNFTFTDTNSEITTLNITTSGSGSTNLTTMTLDGTSQNISTINVNGNGRLSLSSISSDTKLSTLAISGSAWFSGTLTSNTTNLTSITSSSTGTTTITIDPTKQSFTQTGAGQDVITITSPITQSIKAGTNANNYLIWSGAAPSSVVGTGGTLSGFNNLGVASGSGTFNMSNIGVTASSITLTSTLTSNVGFTNVIPGTALNIDVWQDPSKGGVTYSTSDTAGANDAVTVNLGISPTDPRGLAATPGALTRTGSSPDSTIASLLSLTLQDAATSQTVTNGIGTLKISSNATITNTAQTNTITTVTDTSLSSLTFTGAAATVITTLASDLATSLTINNTSSSTGASSVTNLSDNYLNSLTLSGSGVTTLGTLTSTGTTLTINDTNSNATAVVISNIAYTSLTNLNITGSSPLTATIGSLGTPITSTLLTINNTSSATATTTIYDNSLSTLSISGTGPVTNALTDTGTTLTIIDSNSAAVTTTLTAVSAQTETILNSGTATLTVGSSSNAATSLVTLNLLGKIAYTASGAGTALTTISASSDDGNVSYTTTGALGGALTATFGNGNNTLSFANTSNKAVTATFGNGNNTFTESGVGGSGVITLYLGNGVNAVTLGTGHTGVDAISFTAANGSNTGSFTTITNIKNNDTFAFKFSPIDNTVVNNGLVSSFYAGIAGASTVHGYTQFNDGTNTYLYENTGTVANNELVALVGAAHLFIATGILTVAV